MWALLEESRDRLMQPTPGRGMVALKNAGISENWAMPVVLWDAPEGFDSSMQQDSRSYRTLAWRVSGGPVRRVAPAASQAFEESIVENCFFQPAARDLHFASDAPVRLACFYIGNALVQAAAAEYFGKVPCRDEVLCNDCVKRFDTQLAAALDGYLRRAFDAGEPATRLEMDSRASLLVLHLLKQHSSARNTAVDLRKGGLPPRDLRRVCEAMTRDLGVNMPIKALAALARVSYHHFCHAFKASTGTAPHQWLVQARVERACELLRSTRASVCDIASAVGYDDPNQFTRVFRTRCGTTPCAYRRQW